MRANKIFTQGIRIFVGSSLPNRLLALTSRDQKFNLSLCVGFILVALLSATRLAFLFAHISMDPDEGWNAMHAVLAMGHGTLYPTPNGLVGTNYPPASFFLVGMIGKLIGDMIFAGRLISIAGILCSAGLVWQISLKLTCDRFAATAALLLFCLYNVTLCRSYFGMDDPQWLGQAFALLGLTFLLPSTAHTMPSWQRTSMAALLFVTSGFIKQNLIGIPLAVTLWLVLEDRRAFMIWILASCAALAFGFGLCAHAYGLPFFQSIFFTPRSYIASRAVVRSLPFLLTFSPIIVASYWLMRFRKQDARLRLLLICTFLTLITGIVQRCSAGLDINAHFETLTVLCIISSLALARAPLKWGWFIAPFVILIPLSTFQAWHDITSYPQRLATFQAMKANILAANSPIACEDLAYCYWTNKGYLLDFFLYRQHVLQTKSDATLRAAVMSGKIRLAQIFIPHDVSKSNTLVALIQGLSSKTIYLSGNNALIALSPQLAENKPSFPTH